MKSQSDVHSQLQRTLRWVGATGVILLLCATPLYGVKFGANLALGTALAVGNLWTIGRAVRAHFSGAAAGRWGLFVALKFSALVVGLYLLFRSGFGQGLPLAVGLGALPIGIVLAELAGPLAVKEG